MLLTMFFAFLQYGHKAEELAYSARVESVNILDELHWCVKETSFLVDTT